MPAIKSGTAARLTSRAPIASATRPPICIERIAAAPPQKSMIAICVASKPSLSRREGSEPPNPPITAPLTTNISVTAIAATRVESWLTTGAEVVIRSFCIDLVMEVHFTQNCLGSQSKELRLGPPARAPATGMWGPEPCDRLSTCLPNGRSRIDEAPTRSARMFHNQTCSQARRCVRLALSNPRGRSRGPIQGLVRCGVKLISIRHRGAQESSGWEDWPGPHSPVGLSAGPA